MAAKCRVQSLWPPWGVDKTPLFLKRSIGELRLCVNYDHARAQGRIGVNHNLLTFWRIKWNWLWEFFSGPVKSRLWRIDLTAEVFQVSAGLHNAGFPAHPVEKSSAITYGASLPCSTG